MARNEEKAQSMLNRFIALKAEEEKKKKPKERRPFLASECRHLSDAVKWRKQIMREIRRKIVEIANEELDEHRLRHLNNEINRLIHEKSHCERRIDELGGPKYAGDSTMMTGFDCYRFFGAAKKLPEFRELFEKPFEKPPELRKRRYDIYERVEGPAEKKMRREVAEEWQRLEEINKIDKMVLEMKRMKLVNEGLLLDLSEIQRYTQRYLDSLSCN